MMIPDQMVADNNREFGMQGYPDIRTVEEWDDDKTQLFPQSRTSVNHNKAVSWSFRL
jgi:beta-mannosidase